MIAGNAACVIDQSDRIDASIRNIRRSFFAKKFALLEK
jgi:hypothetical protein